MWSLISVLLFASSAIGRSVTLPSTDSRIKLAGAGWRSVNASACGAGSQTMEVTGNVGDTMTLRFQGVGQLAVFGTTLSNGATVRFQLDQQSSTVDLSQLNNAGQDLCFPVFTANGLDESEVHTLTATHSGVGGSANLQGSAVFGLTQIILQTSSVSSSSSSPAPSSSAELPPSSTSQPAMSTSIPTPGLSAAKSPSGEHGKSSAGLIVGVIILLLALAALFVTAYVFWRKRNERIRRATEEVVSPPQRVDSIGDPDVLGKEEKWISFDATNDVLPDRKILPGTLPRVMLRSQSPRPSLISNEIPTACSLLNPPPYPQIETRRPSTSAQEVAQIETLEKELQNPRPVGEDETKVEQQQSVEEKIITTPSPEAEATPPITSAAQFPYPPPPMPPGTLPPSSGVPLVLKPGNGGQPQIKLEIPSSDGKKRPVSTASSWRTVGTPFTPYAGVVAFSTREVMRVEQPLFSWQAGESLAKGQAPDSEGR